MNSEISYRKAFYIALTMHVLLMLFLLMDLSNKPPALVRDNQNLPGQIMPITEVSTAQPEIVKAVAVDQKEVQDTVKRLQAEKLRQQKAEQAQREALRRQAEQAKQQRIQEQQRLAKLKEEAEKIAILRKKQIEEEQKRLKQMTLQKEQEAKRLAELKRQQQELEKQQQETEKRALVQKKKEEENLAKEQAKQKALEKAVAEKAASEKARAELAAKEAALQAANQARMAGEIDRYKALILNAIGRNWILPDNVDRHLSGKFHIRLAPDGSVLEVTLVQSSGDPILDRSAQTAIYKASPLPVPNDPQLFNLVRDINLTVRPEDVRG